MFQRGNRYLPNRFFYTKHVIFSNKKRHYLKTNRLILLDSVSEPFNSYWERRKHCTVLTTFNTKFCSIFYFFTISIYALGITYIKSNANQFKLSQMHSGPYYVYQRQIKFWRTYVLDDSSMKISAHAENDLAHSKLR